MARRGASGHEKENILDQRREEQPSPLMQQRVIARIELEMFSCSLRTSRTSSEIVTRRPGSPIVTDFVACDGCRAVYFAPVPRPDPPEVRAGHDIGAIRPRPLPRNGPTTAKSSIASIPFRPIHVERRLSVYSVETLGFPDARSSRRSLCIDGSRPSIPLQARQRLIARVFARATLHPVRRTATALSGCLPLSCHPNGVFNG